MKFNELSDGAREYVSVAIYQTIGKVVQDLRKKIEYSEIKCTQLRIVNLNELLFEAINRVRYDLRNNTDVAKRDRKIATELRNYANTSATDYVDRGVFSFQMLGLILLQSPKIANFAMQEFMSYVYSPDNESDVYSNMHVHTFDMTVLFGNVLNVANNASLIPGYHEIVYKPWRARLIELVESTRSLIVDESISHEDKKVFLNQFVGRKPLIELIIERFPEMIHENSKVFMTLYPDLFEIETKIKPKKPAKRVDQDEVTSE